MTTTTETLKEYIGYLEAKVSMQADELAEVYAFCDDPQDETRTIALDNIGTRHDSYILDSHFAEVIAEVAQMKAGMNEPQAPELTADDKVMLLNLYHCPLETIHPLLKHEAAKNRLDKLVKSDYVWLNRAGTDYVISSKGGLLVMEWEQEIAYQDGNQ